MLDFFCDCHAGCGEAGGGGARVTSHHASDVIPVADPLDFWVESPDPLLEWQTCRDAVRAGASPDVLKPQLDRLNRRWINYVPMSDSPLLLHAVKLGRTEVLAELLARGANADPCLPWENDRPPLVVAAAAGRLDIVDMLCDQADIEV